MTRVLDMIAGLRGYPETIVMDNELSAKVKSLTDITKAEKGNKPISICLLRAASRYAIAPTMMTQGL